MSIIEFTDLTMIEGQGHFNLVSDLMANDVGDYDWMLDSLAYIKLNEKVIFTYALHLWKSGEVDIFDTDRPTTIDVPEDDLRELHRWCNINNWKSLHIDDRLLVDPRSFDFWVRMYRCGLVENKQLQAYDESETSRLSQNGDYNVN